MATITTRDGTEIYFKDWGKGQPVIFSHGWPLDADMWEYQMNFLAEKGYRVIAYDRRGFGRSSQPWDGYNYDTFADDLAELIEALDLKEAVLVGFSMGGGDVARYIGRHGVKRLSKAVLVGAVTPIFIKTDSHPEGVPKEVFDGIKDGLRADRAQFLTDFREDMKKFTLPTLVIHGDDDQVVPLEATGKLAAAAVPGSQLKVYPGAPHALCFTHKDQLNLDLLGFLQAR